MRDAYRRATAALRESPGAAAAAVACAIFLVWAAADGGFDPLDWLPGTLFLIALLLVAARWSPGPFAAPTAIRVALVALLALTCLSYVSMLWAAAPSTAWSGANKTLLYLVVYAVFVLRPWRAATAAVMVGAFTVGVALVGLTTFVSTTTADDPLQSFIAGRLATPIAYSNANCALFLMAFWPAVWFASRREAPPIARGVLLATGGVLAELALMTQSRASLVAVPLTFVVFVALVPGRVRAVLTLLPVAAAFALSGSRILNVYDAVVSGQGVRSDLVDARSAILWSCAALIVTGFVIGALDRAVTVPRAVTRAAGVVVAVALVVSAVGATAALANHYGNPVDSAGTWWSSFKAGTYVYEPGTPHLTSGLGSGRYDIWRVAVEMFDARPVVGAGADNFLDDYLRERRRLDDPLYPHSLELRLVSQLGIVGAIAGVVFVVAALIPAARTRLRGSAFDGGVVASLVVAFVYWLIHGTVDWFWAVPALTAPAIAYLAVAGRIGGSVPATAPSGRWRATALLAVAAVVAAVALFPQWIAARDIDAAVSGWRADPEGAFDRLARARSLDPWTDRPDVYDALISAQLGRVARQRSALERVLERNDDNWWALLQIGAMEGRRGRTTIALEWLRRADAANPLEPIVDHVTAEVRAGRPVSDRTIEQMMLDRVDLLVGERQG